MNHKVNNVNTYTHVTHLGVSGFRFDVNNIRFLPVLYILTLGKIRDSKFHYLEYLSLTYSSNNGSNISVRFKIVEAKIQGVS